MPAAEVLQAHAQITARAADIANSKVPAYREMMKQQGLDENIIRRIAQFMGVGNYFRPKPYQSGNSNFGLLIDFNFEGIMDPEARKNLRQTFKQIGADAIRQAVSENTEALRAAIIADARQGNNYFANFKEQRRLFSPDILPLLPKAPRPRSVKTIDDPDGQQGTLF
jgi:hypothetical protein